MNTEEAQALTESIERLNDTASSLTALMEIVDKNQRLLVATQAATLENTDAISMRSTKAELLTEVKRLAVERKKDRTKTKFTVIGAFFVSLVLIVATFITTQEFKDARHDANVSYSTAAREVCLQRSATWEAMRKWIKVQQQFLAEDVVTDPKLKAKRIAAYTVLEKSFPDVNCNIGSMLVGLPIPSGLGSPDNSALSFVPQS